MTDRFWDDPSENDKADKTESVRIIGAEEAAEALERGDVAARRTEGELRYGDRPAPPPEDVEPAIRFPLPPEQSEDLLRPRPVAPSLPHWADPPTGEVPRLLPGGDPAATDDDLEAWSGFAAGGPRWRDSNDDWAEPDFDASAMGGAGDRLGALDDRERPPAGDFFSFDATDATDLRAVEAPAGASVVDEAPVPEEVVPRARPVPKRPRPAPGGAARPPASSGRDMQSALLIGVGLAVFALVLFQIGPAAVLALVTVVLVLAAAELYGALQAGGYQPATLVGLVATGGIVLATYWKGEAAVPLVLTLAVITTLLWFLFGVHTTATTMNVGVSVLGVGYVGLLGSFAALILAFPNEQGLGVLASAIIAVVANDVGALVVGQQVGRAPVAPDVSPNKTIEGTIGGALGSIVALMAIHIVKPIHPIDSFGTAMGLALVVAVMAPLGDLCESLLKRDLGLKDMGHVLPGHGGLLDRFDALLFVLPATYYLCRLLDVI
jgi:phosphatidate cytidylyltransferase